MSYAITVHTPSCPTATLQLKKEKTSGINNPLASTRRTQGKELRIYPYTAVSVTVHEA